MAKGSINIGDEVAITAKVRRRVTEDRVSVSIPSYDQPHSIVDRTSEVTSGQAIELRDGVTRVDEGKVTINLGVPVTVDIGQVRLVGAYVPPRRKTPLVDRPT
jgi:nitrogen fixation protein